MRRIAWCVAGLLVLSGCGGGSAFNAPSAPLVPPPAPTSAGGTQSASALALRTLFVGVSNHTIETFNEATGVQTGQIALPGPASTMPTSMQVSADGRWLYATISPLGGNCSYGESNVVRIDTSTNAIVDTTSTPDAFADAALSSDGSTYAGVANIRITSSGRLETGIDVFSGSDLHFIKQIPLPSAQIPWRITLSRDGSTAYVTDTNSFSMNVYKVDIASGTVTPLYAFPANRTYPVGRPFLDATGTKLYVQTQYGYTILNADTGAKIGSVGLPHDGYLYYDAAQTADRTTIFAIGQDTAGDVQGSLVSTASNSISTEFTGPNNTETGAAVSPDGAAAFGFVPGQAGNAPVEVYLLPSGSIASVAHVPSATQFISAVAGQ